jgi:hypothetical protein
MTTSPKAPSWISEFKNGGKIIRGRASVGKTMLLRRVEAQQSTQDEGFRKPIGFWLPPKDRSGGKVP